MYDIDKIILYSQDRIRLALQNDITYCKSDSCYTKIFFSDGDCVMISKSLAKFSKELNSENFVRVNQSFLVNKNCIKLIYKKSKEIELNNQIKIPFTITIHKLLALISLQLIIAGPFSPVFSGL